MLSSLLVILLLFGQDSVWSVRLVELRVPTHEREGGRALLGCQYDLEGEVLYSVKWYKDELEFFRFVPKNEPQMTSFKRPGVYVDMSRSSSTAVALANLTRESEGVYSCEVSGESPSFTTAKSSKKIEIHLVPKKGPYVTGLQEQYYLDDVAVINCTSPASRPVANLNWLINGQAAPESYIQGPWYRVAETRSDALEEILQLRFTVGPEHFVHGAMHLKCQATIAPLYQRETKSTHYIGLPELMTEKHGLLVQNLSNRGTALIVKHSTMLLIYSAFILYPLRFFEL